MNGIFQINRIVPIVKNLYQRQKSILEGFLLALMSKELIIQYRWSDRLKDGGAFNVLKNTQIVLLNAMLQVDEKYTLYQFQNDCKVVLKKLSQSDVSNVKCYQL